MLPFSLFLKEKFVYKNYEITWHPNCSQMWQSSKKEEKSRFSFWIRIRFDSSKSIVTQKPGTVPYFFSSVSFSRNAVSSLQGITSKLFLAIRYASFKYYFLNRIGDDELIIKCIYKKVNNIQYINIYM